MDDSIGKKMLKSGKCKICTLPDEVLHSILSFLDMKEVVATSLLSTRWRYLWVSQPVLNFNDSLWKINSEDGAFRPEKFINFMDKVLLLHDNSNVSIFQFTCSSYCDEERPEEWLAVAARRGFQEIRFELLWNRRMDFPFLYPYSSLITVLKLDDLTGNNMFGQPPGWICCSPVLKTLLLHKFTLPDGDSDGELVFSNAVLENLTLKECYQAHLDVLNISTYCLKNFVFQNTSYDTIESCQIKLCTPNLASIDFEGFWYENCCLGNLSSLVSAKFDFQSAEPQYLVKILECVSCPTTIGLSAGFECDEELPGKLRRPYTNIRCLKFFNWGSNQRINSYLLNILNICPCLETLYLDAYEIEDREEQSQFTITLHHLKQVRIMRLRVGQNELRFLKFLLKNAIMLEKLVIGTDIPSSDLEAKLDFGDRIHSLTRTSRRLTVLLL